MTTLGLELRLELASANSGKLKIKDAWLGPRCKTDLHVCHMRIEKPRGNIAHRVVL